MFTTRAAKQLRSPILRQLGRRQLHGAGQSGFQGAADNAFNRERAAVKEHAAATSDLWRKLSVYVVVPCIVLAGVNAYSLWLEHWEHQSHMPPKSEQPEYPYQNIRTKNFFWGDGDKTAFWNDKVNYHKKSDE